MESKFTAIAQRAIGAAHDLTTTFAEFVEGLKEMSDEINGVLWDAEEELNARREADYWGEPID